MTPNGTLAFHSLRQAWFDQLTTHLSGLLRRLSPEIYSAIPHDLGTHDLLAATVLARVAQADMERREIAFVAGDLVRLAGPQGVRAPERVSEVEELWTALRHPTSPLLHSWWREPLGEGLLSHWARTRADAVGWPQVHSELRERWSLDSDGIWRRGLGPVDASGDGGWCGYFAYLDAHTDDREAAFARVILERTPGLAEEIDAYASECAGELAYVPYLALVHRERVLAEALTIVIEGNHEAGGEGLPADLVDSSRSLRDAGRAYLRWLADDFVPQLTPLERAHLDLGTAEAARAEAYLGRYAGIWCAPGDPALPTPVFTEEDYAPLKPAERPRAFVPAWMAMLGKVLSGTGQLGWTGVVGSQPWWLYVAEAGMESAAALRFKHDGQVRIGHRTLDDPHDMLVGFPKHDPDAQSLHMRFRYDEDDAHQMCELLALARAGRAQLGFLIRDASGAYRMLRVVSVPIPPPLRAAMRDKAVRRLDAMTGGEPGALSALIAPEPDGTPPSASTANADVTAEAGADADADADSDSSGGWEFADGTLFPREDTLFEFTFGQGL